MKERRKKRKMGWKYRGGLLLIIGVVIMWVTSAEVNQVSSCYHRYLSGGITCLKLFMFGKF